MKINNLHLKNQEKSHLEQVSNDLNTTQTIFKNRVSFIALSENQELILNVVNKVENILDFDELKTDLFYSLIYKEILISLKNIEPEGLDDDLRKIVHNLYDNNFNNYSNEYSRLFYYINYLKNIWIPELEIIEFINSLNLNKKWKPEWGNEDDFNFSMWRGRNFNQEELKKRKERSVWREALNKNDRNEVQDLYSYMERSRSRTKEIEYWKEIIKRLEYINEKCFSKEYIKESLLERCKEIKNNLEKDNLIEAEVARNKFSSQMIEESKIMERNFNKQERWMDFEMSL